MSKIALLAYHKNIKNIYPSDWVEQYKHSILNQTHQDFDIFEQNYGGEKNRIFENSIFESIEMPTFVHALNYLMDKCFSSGYNYVLNSNCDDWFSLDRIEKQIPYLEAGYDLVSSNFALVQDNQIIKYHQFHNLNIQEQLDQNHNIICHPCAAYSRNFWTHNRYLPEEQPFEDIKLWQRAIKHSKFYIVEDNLLFHRIHPNSVCQSENR